jgi:hypothetical protein
MHNFWLPVAKRRSEIVLGILELHILFRTYMLKLGIEDGFGGTIISLSYFYGLIQFPSIRK